MTPAAQRFPLDAPLNPAAIHPASALADALAQLDRTDALRRLLASPNAAPLTAALLVESASLQLANGSTIPIEERLLDNGAADLTDADAITMPCADRAGAWLGDRVGVALSLRIRDRRIADAAAVIVGVAPYPLRARQIEGALRGRAASPQLLDIAAQTARIEAQPFGIGDIIDEAALERLAKTTRAALQLALSRAP